MNKDDYDPMKELSNAIVLQAYTDFINDIADYKKTLHSLNYLTSDILNIFSFANSKWYKDLTDVKSEIFIAQLEKRLQESKITHNNLEPVKAVIEDVDLKNILIHPVNVERLDNIKLNITKPEFLQDINSLDIIKNNVVNSSKKIKPDNKAQHRAYYEAIGLMCVDIINTLANIKFKKDKEDIEDEIL